MSLPDIAGLELLDLIGKGSCGSVYRAASSDTREACAVKVFSSMSINRKLLTIGMRGLQQMPEHPGIIKVLRFDFERAPYHVVTPLVGFMTEDGQRKKHWDTPTLETCCGKVPADEAWRYIYEVCDSMAWLHKHNLVHCNLKPRNVLIEDDQASATKICDPVQGWIGGVHHFDSTDHFLYIPPEQAEHPDALATHGTQWDVYSFGVLAYRLLTGKFPRAEEELARELSLQHAGGVVKTVDNALILAAVRGQPEIAWPKRPTSKWDERRKQIIAQCLALDPKMRWPDLREVMREFEKLEADFLLEDAREKIDTEKRRQGRRVLLLRTAAQVLGTALVVSTGYGLWYGWNQSTRRHRAESINQTISQQSELTLKENEGKIVDLATKLQQAREVQRMSDANLQHSQAAVDQFLTQLLQLPSGLGMQAEVSQKQINDALRFCEQERPRLELGDDLMGLRARNYFNTAQLLMHKNERTEAHVWFDKARTTLHAVLQKEPNHADVPRYQALLGRTSRWLGTLRGEDGRRVEATELFKEAATMLTPVVEQDPLERTNRMECAAAWYELGKRSRRDGETAVAVNSLGRVPALLDTKVIQDVLTTQEQFLLARSRIEQALSLRDQGKLDEAMRALFDSMEVMVKIVEKSAPNNQEQALTLAESYIEFGEIVAGKLGTTDARDAQTEAQAILMELVRNQPQWAEARYLLARNYGDLAALARDMGNASEARSKQEAAVKTLEELSKDNPENTRFLSEYARQKGAHAQLLCDLGRPKDSIPIATDAVQKLELLMQKSGNMLDALDSKSCGVLLAQLYGILGHSGEVAKDNKLAKSSFTKASERWAELKTAHANDEIIDAGLNWSKERLGKFK